MQSSVLVDASLTIAWLTGNERGQVFDWERSRLYIPAVLHDLEVISTLRRLAKAELTETEVEGLYRALDDYDLRPLPVVKEHRARVWSLRHVLTPYDAVYIALAESINMPLWTLDRKLAKAHGHEATVVTD